MTFTVHIITPRHDPMTVGLSEFYARIAMMDPQREQSRHLLEDDLLLMHRSWQQALSTMKSMGCIDWRVSHSPSDLPVRRAA